MQLTQGLTEKCGHGTNRSGLHGTHWAKIAPVPAGDLDPPSSACALARSSHTAAIVPEHAGTRQPRHCAPSEQKQPRVTVRSATRAAREAPQGLRHQLPTLVGSAMVLSLAEQLAGWIRQRPPQKMACMHRGETRGSEAP